MQGILIADFVEDVAEIWPVELPRPHRHPDEYLIRVTHVSPQHADILHANGKHQNVSKKGHIRPPFILGYSFAGVIEEVETTPVTHKPFRKGDRVFGAHIGAFAEQVCVRPEHIRRIPDSIDSASACAMSGQLVSFAAVKHIAKVKPGETVLVSGASGGLGYGCCAVAKAVGAKVIALTSSEEKAALMRENSDIDHVVLTQGDWTRNVLTLTSGNGVEAVFDNTGMVNEALTCLGYEGRIIVLGFAARNGVMEEVKMNRVLLKSASVIGLRFGQFSRRFPERFREISNGFEELVASGKYKPKLYGKYHGWEDVIQALRDLSDQKVYGKVVVSLDTPEDQAKAKL